MTKFDNLYSTQDHLREEQQKLLKALLQNQSAKTQKPSGAPAEVAPEIDVKKAKDLKVSFHSDKKCLENNSSGNNDHYYYLYSLLYAPRLVILLHVCCGNLLCM